MKKLALTSLLAVFAVSSANAASVINGDPLYRPAEGHFYSVTELETSTNASQKWTLNEEFGYGITDRFAVSVETSGTEGNWFDSEENSWNNIAVSANWRMLNKTNWKADLFGTYGVNKLNFASEWEVPAIRSFDTVAFDKDNTFYSWKVGARAGYTTVDWTVAGRIEYTYINSESFNWDEIKNRIDDEDAFYRMRQLTAAADAWWKASDFWSLVTSLEYNTFLNSANKGEGWWTGKFGVNLNLDDTKYVGAYVSKEMYRGEKDAETGNRAWNVADGFGFGVKFGIDF